MKRIATALCLLFVFSFCGCETEDEDCCKVCYTGKPCGDSCIDKQDVCHKPKGCACTKQEYEEITDEDVRPPKKNSQTSTSTSSSNNTNSTSNSCCKVCRTGCACGDSCISCSKTCHQPSGCACNG